MLIVKAPKISALNTSFSDPFTFSVSSSAATTWIFLLHSYLNVVYWLSLCCSGNGRNSLDQWVQFFKNFVLPPSKEIFLEYWKSTTHTENEIWISRMVPSGWLLPREPRSKSTVQGHGLAGTDKLWLCMYSWREDMASCRRRNSGSLCWVKEVALCTAVTSTGRQEMLPYWQPKHVKMLWSDCPKRVESWWQNQHRSGIMVQECWLRDLHTPTEEKVRPGSGFVKSVPWIAANTYLSLIPTGAVFMGQISDTRGSGGVWVALPAIEGD